jgi:CheY-like chemotaxis protein
MIDLISLRALVASPSAADRDLLRRGAALASVPVDLLEAATTADARAVLSDRVDVVLLDHVLGRDGLVKAARAVPHPPLLIALVAPGASVDAATLDGVATTPAGVDEATALIERYVRLKVPSRALVVDDSSTMRAIVRKILSASRVPLEIAEAGEGMAALAQVGAQRFDIVFLDYNMPGLDGLQTLSEIKRSHPDVEVVLMTSARDNAVAERARAAGAVAFLRKPFYPADVDAILNQFHGRRAMNTQLI